MTKKESIKLFVRKILYSVINGILGLIPKKRGLVLFTSWLGQKYLDNPKYVYEYFLEHSKYRPMWLTKSVSIYENLKNEGKAILMISEELPELIGMSDRILIFKDGTVKGSFMRSADLTEHDLIDYMI